ncbi:hypothetical protein [Arhodomonas sp. AD133]|uniref:hypothetical protein n=1 Tax=Arhodomonas sp. AD133 TaxID=3415009 RepID=UPI003EC07643
MNRRDRLWRWYLAAQAVIAPTGVAVLVYLLVQALPFVRVSDVAAPLLLSCLVAAAGYAAFGLRLGWVLDAFSLKMPWPSVWRIHLTSLFYYFFLPAGVGYDLSKGAKIAARTRQVRKRRIASAVLGERLVGGAGVYVLLLGAWPFIEFGDGSRVQAFMPARWVWPSLVAATVIGVIALVHWARRRGATAIRPLLIAVSVSAGAHLIVATAVWLVASALVLPISLADVVAAMAATLLFQLVPVNLVGVSLGEVAAVAVYLALGLERPEALLLATVAYAHRLVIAVVGGFLEGIGAARGLLHGRLSRPRLGHD